MTQPRVSYRRSTLKDERGASKILIIFSLPAGETKPPEDVIQVMRAHKFWRDGKPYGLADDARAHDESYPTHLTFGQNRKYPTAWELPDTPFGREVADGIDRALHGLVPKREGHDAPEMA
jgi:hypothetical protein